jgi:hypothetical protein
MPRAGAHALLTRPPLGATPKDDAPFDLHVLGAPPAFVLSQDQTLSFIPFSQQARTLLERPVSHAEHRRQVKPALAEGPSASHGNPQAQRPAGPHRSSARPKGPRILKGNDQGPLRRSPTPVPPCGRTDNRLAPDKTPPSSSRCAKDQQPQQGRRPRIPSCLFPTLSNSRRCGAGHTASAPPQRDPLYSQFAPAAQGSFLRKFDSLTLMSKYSIQH